MKQLSFNKKLTLKRKLYFVLAILLVLFFSFFVYILKEYIETHTFTPQVPVILRTPVIIERVEIISPLSTTSGLLNIHVEAKEIENPHDLNSPKGIGWKLIYDKWGVQEWGAFDELVMRESGWNPYSVNSSSGACYLPQALPCLKMNAEPWDYKTQLEWMVGYISQRYKNPTNAIEFHDKNNWY